MSSSATTTTRTRAASRSPSPPDTSSAASGPRHRSRQALPQSMRAIFPPPRTIKHTPGRTLWSLLYTHRIFIPKGAGNMGTGGLVFLALVVVAAIYAIMLYNGLVSLKNNVKEAWSNIDILLKQRHDELPKLVETCKQYMNYERDTLEKVMSARAGVQQAQQSGDIGALGPAESELRSTIGKLYAVAEAYP